MGQAVTGTVTRIAPFAILRLDAARHRLELRFP